MSRIRVIDRSLEEEEMGVLRADMAAAGLFPDLAELDDRNNDWCATVEDRYDGDSFA